MENKLVTCVGFWVVGGGGVGFERAKGGFDGKNLVVKLLNNQIIPN